MGVFDVHDLVADVVGGLDDIDERMAGIYQSAVGRVEPAQAELVGDAAEVVGLGGEEAEFTFGRQHRLVWIFDDGGQCGIGHGETAGPASAKLMGEKTEGVGVALEAGEVAPLFGREF